MRSLPIAFLRMWSLTVEFLRMRSPAIAFLTMRSLATAFYTRPFPVLPTPRQHQRHACTDAIPAPTEAAPTRASLLPFEAALRWALLPSAERVLHEDLFCT